MVQKLILFPFGGNAREAIATVEAINKKKRQWQIIGFADDNQAQWGKECCGYKVLGGQDILAEYPQAKVLAVPGSPANYLTRKKIIKGLKLAAGRFATIIHPSVTIAPDAVLGCNLLVMPNVVISNSVTIGDHCLILPNTVIAHESTIGNYCCIGSNVTISGNVRIGAECYIGSGTSIIDHISIGSRTLVGLGSNVINTIAPDLVVVGNPARIIKKGSQE